MSPNKFAIEVKTFVCLLGGWHDALTMSQLGVLV